MWLFYSVFCMIVLVASDILSKKAMETDKLAPIKLRLLVIIGSFLLSMLIYALGLGESGLAPWQLLRTHPLTLAIAFCLVGSELFYTLCLRYLGVSVMEAISGLEGIVIFCGLLFLHLLSGELSAIRDMLLPARLLLIGCIWLFTFLLSRTDLSTGVLPAKQKSEAKYHTSIGVLLALLAVVLGSGDSLIADALLDSGKIGSVDFTMTVYFSSATLLPVFFLYLFLQRNSTKTVIKGINQYAIACAVLFIFSLFLGAMAASSDAVRAEVMYLAYPVIAILGAKIFLKERYTRQQNIYIWVITAAAICFCAMDYIL